MLRNYEYHKGKIIIIVKDLVRAEVIEYKERKDGLFDLILYRRHNPKTLKLDEIAWVVLGFNETDQTYQHYEEIYGDNCVRNAKAHLAKIWRRKLHY